MGPAAGAARQARADGSVLAWPPFTKTKNDLWFLWSHSALLPRVTKQVASLSIPGYLSDPPLKVGKGSFFELVVVLFLSSTSLFLRPLRARGPALSHAEPSFLAGAILCCSSHGLAISGGVPIVPFTFFLISCPNREWRRSSAVMRHCRDAVAALCALADCYTWPQCLSVQPESRAASISRGSGWCDAVRCRPASCLWLHSGGRLCGFGWLRRKGFFGEVLLALGD
jgi:hypothetical protein